MVDSYTLLFSAAQICARLLIPWRFLTIMSEINAADSIRTFIFASLAATFKYMAVLFIPLCGSLLAQGYRNDLENFTDFFQRGGLFSISRFHMIVILENISSCRSQSPAASEKPKCTAIKPSRAWVLIFFITVQDKVCISKLNKWCFCSQQIHSTAYVSIRWCHRGPPAHQEGWLFGLEYLVQGQFGIRCPWLGLSNRHFDRCNKCSVTWATAASSYAEINIPTDQINHQIVLILL